MNKISEAILRESMHFPNSRGFLVYIGFLSIAGYMSLLFKMNEINSNFGGFANLTLLFFREVGIYFLLIFLWIIVLNHIARRLKEKHFQKVLRSLNEENPKYIQVTIQPQNWFSKILKLTDDLIYRKAFDESGKKYGVYQSYEPNKLVKARLFDISKFAKPKFFHIHHVAIPEDYFN